MCSKPVIIPLLLEGIRDYVVGEVFFFSTGERCEVACQVFDEGVPSLGIGGWQA